NDLTLATNGSFSFTTKQAQGSTFDVKVSSAPVGETCAVATGNGVVGAANVTTAVVTCAPIKHTVSGSLTGQTGAVGLANAGQNLSVSGSSFAFAPQDEGSPYNVAV